MNKGQNKYIPALRFHWLTPLYDFVLRRTMRESAFKRQLVKQARIQKGQRVLDVGCGTATLALMIKRAHPEAEVVGLDGDPEVLKIARAKAVKAGLVLALDEGMAYALPYPDGSFNQAFSSLLLHHLTLENKFQTLKEIFRVLQPDGELHLADIDKPHNILTYLISLITRWFEEASDNIRGLLPQMLRDAGFQRVEQSARFTTVVGTVSLYRAHKSKR